MNRRIRPKWGGIVLISFIYFLFNVTWPRIIHYTAWYGLEDIIGFSFDTCPLYECKEKIESNLEATIANFCQPWVIVCQDFLCLVSNVIAIVTVEENTVNVFINVCVHNFSRVTAIFFIIFLYHKQFLLLRGNSTETTSFRLANQLYLRLICLAFGSLTLAISWKVLTFCWFDQVGVVAYARLTFTSRVKTLIISYRITRFITSWAAILELSWNMKMTFEGSWA